MRKTLLLLVLLTVLLATGCGAAEKPDSPGKIILRDDASLFRDSQEADILEIMQDLSEYGNVAVYTIRQNRYGDTADYAENLYANLFDEDSGLLFIIDMDQREIYVETDGYIGSFISRGRARVLTDNAYRLATNGQYAACAEKVLNQSLRILQGHAIPQPMVIASNAAIAIMLALLINFIVLRSLNSHSDVTVEELFTANRGHTDFQGGNVDVTSTQVVHLSSSHGGGGSRGGGFGGGGHSSHGGGHRF
ncbi:MAG: TPM domain-containing protein [Lachnospiraceae bacterium]|nr:TPM domain-containing protein [Lachnospiraceae bacterium]